MNSRLLVLGGLLLLGVAGIFIWQQRRQPPAYPEITGQVVNSASLRETVIVPTLSTPLADRKSALWCATFQLAWNKLRSDVVKGPVEISNATGICKLLNEAPDPANEIPPEMFYAIAGDGPGIVAKIRQGMSEKFPARPAPELESVNVIAYAYLEAAMRFPLPYFDSDVPLKFTDSAGNARDVSAFGIREKDADAYMKLRHQVEVLYKNYDLRSQELDEFAIDLCRDSAKFQIILARMKRGVSLGDTVANLNSKIAAAKPESFSNELDSTDVLLVPNFNFDLMHHFKELEGPDKILLNSRLYISNALQSIRFKLDRSGVELASEARIDVKAEARIGPDHFLFDRPFLICLKKRGVMQPFFVMWVDNAELLAGFAQQ